MWEAFYLEWVQKDKHILLVYYEDLSTVVNTPKNKTVPKGSKNLEKTLKRIIKFIDFGWNTRRFECLRKEKEGAFHRKKRCINNGSLDLTSVSVNCTDWSLVGLPIPIYSRKHITWIHSAITNVQQALKKIFCMIFISM